MKVLLDTDIGSDIDDAVCLAYLLAQPDCDLLGITTVSGEPVRRAAMASALCHVAGKDIPILPGAADPLLATQRQPHAPQADKLAHWPHKTRFPTGQAVEFLRTTIRAHPGEVTLLTIGPLTNIALLFSIDPEIPHLLQQLVMMCGVFTNRRAGVGQLEWNALLDPHATAIVYRAPASIHRSVGLDVTTQVALPADEVRRRFQHPLLRPVLDFAEVWFERQDRIVFHDPLAAAAIFDASVCAFTRGRVEVELQSARLGGLTAWTPDPAGPHEVALEVDADRFFAHYFATVEKYPAAA
ncbi:MAG TPA: nucleoside hydrolase [Chloroflexi bacterium]|nr:nucleoside hydrolase [Chloroflexota bacterium]